MGCSESKHAIATTESFSTHKKLTSERSRKIQDSKISHDSKQIDIKENSTDSNATLNDVRNQEVETYATQDECAIKQVENNTSINASRMKDDLTFKSKDQEEDKELQVSNSEVLLPSGEEEGYDYKFSTGCQDEHLSMNEESRKLSSLDSSRQTCASQLGEKQIELVESDIDLNNMKDEINEQGMSKITKEVEVQNALNETEKTLDDKKKDIETRHEEVLELKPGAGQKDDKNKLEVKQDNVAGKIDARQEVIEIIAEEGKEDVEKIPINYYQEIIETKDRAEQENDEMNIESIQQENVETTPEKVLENDKNKINADQDDVKTKFKDEQEIVEMIPEVEHDDVATPKPMQEDITTAMVVFGRMRESVLQKIEQDSESQNALTCS